MVLDKRNIPDWMQIIYIWILKNDRKLEDLWISRNSFGEILIAPKETTPLAYEKIGDGKTLIKFRGYKGLENK